MKFKILVLFIFSACFNLFGQQCDCLKNITLLQQKVEDNQASYQHQVIEQKRLDDYVSFKTDINAKAQKITGKKDCIGLVSLYLSFFRDEHSFISYINNYTPEPNKIIKPSRRNGSKSSSFEGIWYFQDGSFSMNVFRTETAVGEWVGVINDDKSKSWKKGQIKVELFHNANGSLGCIYWRKNLIPKTYPVSLTDSTMTVGRNLIFYRKRQAEQINTIQTNDLHFIKLSEETNYLKLQSFDLSFKNKIDSLIGEKRIEIVSRKNLIIDIRNNGGGGFEVFQSILPYIMDTHLNENPYYGSVWVSKDNYDFYDSTKYEYTESKQDSINELNYVEYLKGYLNSYTPIEREKDTILLEKNAPSTIAILYNRNTASTAEGFILYAGNSKKVKTFGENSAGAVSYGDWMPMNLPELDIWVAITTKKMVFKNNEDFESIGISPDIDLTYTNEDEWLKIILEQIEK